MLNTGDGATDGSIDLIDADGTTRASVNTAGSFVTDGDTVTLSSVTAAASGALSIASGKATSGASGLVLVAVGGATANTGDLTMTAGLSTAGAGGDVTMVAGATTGTSAVGGHVTIAAGASTTDTVQTGGSVNLIGGVGSSTSGSIVVKGTVISLEDAASTAAVTVDASGDVAFAGIGVCVCVCVCWVLRRGGRGSGGGCCTPSHT